VILIRRALIALTLAALLSGHAVAQSTAEVRKGLIVATIAETMLASASLTQTHARQSLREFKWSSRYSDREWSLTGTGSTGNRKITISVSGFIWGDQGQDLLVTYAGSGMSGDEPILLYGRADWPYDRERKDYLTTDFRHAMKFGKNSFWGWVTGSEIVVGGVVGAGGAVATTTVATGGLALGAAAWIGGAGAVAGSSALVSVSQAVKSLQESNTPVAAPALPPRPEPPAKGEPLKPQDGKIIVVRISAIVDAGFGVIADGVSA
jgi:hypothetical protein